MSARTALVAACTSGDEVGVDLAGWSPVVRALGWWTKPGRVTLEATVAPIADGVGEEDPERIVEALRVLLIDGLEWRPSAAQILTALHPPVAPVHPGRERPPRPDRLPQTDAAVRRAAAAGADVCDCRPRPVQLRIDGNGVLTCPDCGGLEVGQYENAIEPPEEDE